MFGASDWGVGVGEGGCMIQDKDKEYIGSRLCQVMFVKNFDMYIYPRISKSSLKCFK